MIITEQAKPCDINKISNLDRHIPPCRLEECIENGQVYILKVIPGENHGTDISGSRIAGVLRYSLFWQTIPFLELIYLEEPYRRCGFGTEMMKVWENLMGTSKN